MGPADLSSHNATTPDGDFNCTVETSWLYIQEKKQVQFYIYGVIIPCVIVPGLLGDLLNIAVLWKSPRLAGMSYTYVRWLSISDLLDLICWVQFMAVMTGQVAWSRVTAAHVVHMLYLPLNGLMHVSNYLILALTIDRYLSVCCPLSVVTRVTRSKRVMHTVVALAFFLGLAMAIPELTDKQVVRNDLDNCESHDEGYTWVFKPAVKEHTLYKVWVAAKLMIGDIFPVMLVSVFNPLIIRAHRNKVRKRKELGSRETRDQAREARQEYRILVLLVTVSAMFVFCTLPKVLTTFVLRTMKPATLTFSILRHTSNLLSVINVSINFYLYSLTGTDFRHAFMEVCCACYFNRVHQTSSG